MNAVEGNKKLLWKLVLSEMRKGEQVENEIVNDVNGQIMRNGVEVRRRFAEYFEQQLNAEDIREANTNAFGDRRLPVLGELNEAPISIEELREQMDEMKSRKAPGLDGFAAKCLKKCGISCSVRMVRETVEIQF